MSPSVFLAPCDPGNFDRTVRSPVDPSEHPDHPDPFDGMDAVRFWGARSGPRNEDTFDRMEPGDLVLFYQEGTYVATGRIGTTFEDSEGWASETFWDDAPSRLVYTIGDYAPASVPAEAVHRLFDYDDGYFPQGLMRVADRRVDRRPAVIEAAMERYSAKHG